MPKRTSYDHKDDMVPLNKELPADPLQAGQEYDIQNIQEIAKVII